MVYFVLGLALFSDGYEEVLAKLVQGLRFARVWSTRWVLPSTAAMSQARARLGETPVRELFERLAVPLAQAGTPGAWLRSWRLMAIDGVMLDVPDTGANVAEYPKAVGGTRRPFPQVRAVGLGECGTHALIAAELGSISTGERRLAHPLAARLDANMLVLADRGFFSYDLWRQYMLTGAALVWRMTATINLPVRQVLGDGSYLSEIASAKVRGGKTRIPLDKVDDPHLATHIPVRVIEYTIDAEPGGDAAATREVFRLITTILDPDTAGAAELAAAYAQRWEFETSLREIKANLREPGATLRSKSPAMARQEIWGLFLTHYAVRAFMVEAADTVDIDPDRLSFTRTLNIIRRQVTDPAGFSPRQTNPDPPADDF